MTANLYNSEASFPTFISRQKSRLVDELLIIRSINKISKSTPCGTDRKYIKEIAGSRPLHGWAMHGRKSATLFLLLDLIIRFNCLLITFARPRFFKVEAFQNFSKFETTPKFQQIQPFRLVPDRTLRSQNSKFKGVVPTSRTEFEQLNPIGERPLAIRQEFSPPWIGSIHFCSNLIRILLRLKHSVGEDA